MGERKKAQISKTNRFKQEQIEGLGRNAKGRRKENRTSQVIKRRMREQALAQQRSHAFSSPTFTILRGSCALLLAMTTIDSPKDQHTSPDDVGVAVINKSLRRGVVAVSAIAEKST